MSPAQPHLKEQLMGWLMTNQMLGKAILMTSIAAILVVIVFLAADSDEGARL